MTIRQKQAAFLKMVAKLIDNTPDDMVCLELYRSLEAQKAAVASGHSWTMDSKHLIGLAIDLAFLTDILDDGVINFPKEKYLPLGLYWESLGGRWGGRFGVKPIEYSKMIGKDAGHFEYNG